MNFRSLIFPAAVISAAAGLQVEVTHLSKSLDALRQQDALTAKAVTKFEHDVFARQAAKENIAQAQRALEDAARRRDIDQGLNSLPPFSRVQHPPHIGPDL